jgi:hypothetical protein
MKTLIKKFATMTNSGATIVIAKSKKEAAEKLNVSIKKIYRYNK